MSDLEKTAQWAGSMLWTRAAIDVDSIDEESRTAKFTVSTESIDGHGTIVRQNWDLKRFRSNPVVFFSHDSRSIPIGTASKVAVRDGKLEAVLKFSTEELNPEAERVWKNVKAKVLRGVSPGFLPRSAYWEKHDNVEVLVLDDNELFEISVTGNPSNPDALAHYRSMAGPGEQIQKPPPPAAIKSQDPPTAEPQQKASAVKLTMEMRMDRKKDETDIVMDVARELALPVGSTERDVQVRVALLRDLEKAVLTATGVANTAEAIGAVRALKESADRLEATETKLAEVQAKQNRQEFEALVNQAQAERKMSPAECEFKRNGFNAAEESGAEDASKFVAELRGWINIAAPRIPQRVKPKPEERANHSEPLTFNGKRFVDMKPAERARLSDQEPELYEQMREQAREAGEL